MKKKILFIFNPRSGKGSIKGRLLDILDIFIRAEYEVTIHPTQAYQDGMKVARERGGDFDLVVISGGDGTLDEVVTGLMEGGHRALLGYIPAGSTNDFANSLHISKNMLQAATDIVNGQVHAFDVGQFNDDFFVYVAAFGLFTEVSYETNQDLKNMLGHVAYILEGAQRLFDIRSYKMTIENDNTILEGDFIFGMISNATSVGGFRKLTGPDVLLDDGLFEVLLVRRPKNLMELNEIIAYLIGDADTNLIETFKTSKLKIQSETSISWTLDGEFGGEHEEVDIVNLRHAMDIITGVNKKMPIKSSAILDF